MMRVFLIGGTGQVGSLVASGLAAKGADVRVLSRSAERAAALPSGQTGVVGDMFAVDVLREEIGKADGVFLLFPPDEAISFMGLTVLGVAREHRPSRMIVMTGQDCFIHAPSGHIGSLLPVEMALAQSGLPYTLLNPNYFFQNDERQRSRLLDDGVYGTPLGDVGLSRCDVGDIADAAIASFDRAGTERLRVCGPDVLTGERTAQIWSTALGRPIRYGGHADMAAFEQRLVAVGTAPHWALDIRMMYESFQTKGLVATAEDVERLAERLGRAPRTFEDFTEETARRWRNGTTASEAPQW